MIYEGEAGPDVVENKILKIRRSQRQLFLPESVLFVKHNAEQWLVSGACYSILHNTTREVGNKDEGGDGEKKKRREEKREELQGVAR